MLDQIGKRLNAITKANFGVYSVGRESNLDDLQQDITNEIGFQRGESSDSVEDRMKGKAQEAGRQVGKILVVGMEGWIQKKSQKFTAWLTGWLYNVGAGVTQQLPC